MADYSELLDSLSPLTKLGIDPDEAAANRDEVMQQVQGVPQVQPQTAPSQPVSVPSTVSTSGQPDSYNDAVKGSIGRATNYSQQGADALTQWKQRNAQLQQTGDTLQQQRQQAAQPIDAVDPATGKMNQRYRPSLAQKIYRGVQAVARGGVLAAADPTAAGVPGYTAPNAQYGRDVQSQQGRVASIDAGLAANKDALKNAADFGKDLSGAERAQATTEKDIAGSATSQQNANTTAAELPIKKQQADAETTNAQSKTPGGVEALSDAEYRSRTKAADTLKLKGQNRSLYIANGRLPDPRQATEDEIATSQATKVFTQENGHPPQTLDDYNKIRQAAKGSKPQGSLMLVPDGKGGSVAKFVQAGDPVPPGSTPINKGGSGNGATVADKNRSSLAKVASENLDQIEDIVNRRPELVGASGGRISSVKDLIGSNDPDLVALGNAVHNFAMANAGIHGSRSHENVVDAENEVINHMKSGVEGIRGGIKANRQNLKSIIERVDGTSAAPASGQSGGFNWDSHPVVK